MKVFGALLMLIALIASTIVSYHVTKAAAPDYMTLWTISVVLIIVGYTVSIIAELQK